MDVAARLVLGVGVLVSGAALAFWFVPGRSSIPPATAVVSAPAPAPPSEPPAPAPKPSPEDAMTGFFKSLPPPRHAPAPTIDSFAGTWTATIVSVDMDGDAGPIRDARSAAPFKFTIKVAGGEWQMASPDGRGTPRTLVADAGGVLARGDGAPNVRLKLRDGRLVGLLETAKGRVEFHAAKDP